MAAQTKAKPKKPRPVEPIEVPPDARMLTVDEVADELRISTTSVRRLVGKGILKSLPVTVGGSTIRIRRETLEDFIRTQEQGAPPESTEPIASDAPSPQSYSLTKAGWDGKNRLPAERPKRTGK